MGVQGLKLLSKARAETGLAVVTEALEPEMVDVVAEHADIVQIGARNMQNYPLLRRAGRAGKPILLKRGLAATIRSCCSVQSTSWRKAIIRSFCASVAYVASMTRRVTCSISRRFRL
jgi:sialic acid synthase SpsE